MTQVLIGTDAGTTNIKTVAFTLDGHEIHREKRSNGLQHPEPGWVEQDMQRTWDQTAATIRDTVNALDESTEIIAIGITGQGDGCWLIDEIGDPVDNAILWSDGRASEYVKQWQADGRSDFVRERCGCDLFPGASLPILQWLKENSPDTLSRADTTFFCKDWIKYKITGKKTTDLTDASLPYINLGTDDYVDDLLSQFGLEEVADLLPPLVPSTEIIGKVTEQAAATTNLPPNTPVVSGMIDVTASALGSGVARTGNGSSVVGTTSLNQAILNEPPTTPTGTGFTFSTGEGMYFRAMASMAGTPNLDWMFEEIFQNSSYGEMVPEIEKIPIGSEGLLYHPYLSSSGERSPFLKTTARAQFIGLSPNHTRFHLLRAVYEGVSLAMRDCYEHMPMKADRIMISGGGANSDFWCQMFADTLGTTIAIPKGTEFGAKGAALLAGVGIGEYNDIQTAVDETTTIDRTYEPNPQNVPHYDICYDFFREAYETTFPIWEKRSEVLAELTNLDSR